MTERPRILAIGGVDPSGGAGLAADARMIQARGALPLLVPACLTVQNRRGFSALHPVDGGVLAAMVRSALGDGQVAAIKTGLLGTASTVATVADALRESCRAGVPLVVDPVLSATAGGLVVEADVVAALLETLLPLAAVVTPNLPELDRLAKGDPAVLLGTGARAVLVKGGHGSGDAVEDRLLTAAGETAIRHPRIEVGNVRGTGCALASALACELAGGTAVEAACRSAVDTLSRCLERTSPAADGAPAILAVE